MSKTIWKFPLDIKAGPQNHMMPKGALFLSAQLQYGTPTMWFEVDPSHEKEERSFWLIGTGTPLPPSCKIFRNTFQFQYGQTVAHLYEADLAEDVMATGILPYENITQFPLMQTTGTA